MAIPTSSAPAARLWLFHALVAALLPDAALVDGQGYYGDPQASLLVCLDEPGAYQPADIVSVGKVTRDIETSSMVGSGGAGWLAERYSIHVTIEIARGDDAQSAFERTFALLDQTINVVRADPTLGGAVLWARPQAHDVEVMWTSDHTGRVGQVEIPISCYQRI